MDTKSMQDLNFRKSSHVVLKVLNSTILSVNLLAALGSLAVIVARLSGAVGLLPKLLDPYTLGPLSILNALFVVLMSNAYDRYYDLYTRAGPTTLLGDLLDVIIKMLLLASSFVLLAFPYWLAPLVWLSYALSHLRLRELKRSTDRNNPFHWYLNSFLLPNNVRHNQAMLYLFLLWLTIQSGKTPEVSSLLLSAGLTVNPALRDDVTTILGSVYSLFFIVYWSGRMVLKRVVGPNEILKAPGLAQIDREISEYLAEGDM